MYKKDSNRFTIRFNASDPRQLSAMNILNAAGRRKSTLIADALHYYLYHGSNNICIIPLNTCSSDSKSELPTLSLPNIKAASSAEATIEDTIAQGAANAEISPQGDGQYDDKLRDVVLDAMKMFS